MQLKTSFCNKTIFKKNLTRFAPVWGVYTLCLILGVLLLYSDGGTDKDFYFARNMVDLVEVMAMVNLGYALIVAQLLFGDLYNSRMCNMLHAFPLRRESWFCTNILSGIVFSLVPTAVMALVSMPLLADSMFADAWTLSWWVFLASNLQFLCFFGMAVFAAMCVGNRFTMVAGYGLLNAGAGLAYYLVDTVYTPMLYGVITPAALANDLTPLYHMVNKPYLRVDAYLHDLRQLYGPELKGAVATFTVTENWWQLWVLAGVGLVFALLGLLLYRKRNLECAADAVAFQALVPVFQVLCAIFVATGAQLFLYIFLDQTQNFLFLGTGLVVGWFVGKMLLERTTRVFQLRNFYGLAVLAAVFAVSLWMTHIDILGIETRLPDGDKVKFVSFYADNTEVRKITEKEQIEDLLLLQQKALEFRAEDSGTYILVDGERVRYADSNAVLIDEEGEYDSYFYAANVSLTYEMENGKQIRRRYNVWVDSQAGALAKQYLSQWEHLNTRTITVDGEEVNRLEMVMKDFRRISGDTGVDWRSASEVSTDKAAAEQLLAAIRKDCVEGTMAQNSYFHTGHFRYEDVYAEEDGIHEQEAAYLTFSGEKYSWHVRVYADSRNTVQWLKDHDLLAYEVCSDSIRIW